MELIYIYVNIFPILKYVNNFSYIKILIYYLLIYIIFMNLNPILKEKSNE